MKSNTARLIRVVRSSANNVQRLYEVSDGSGYVVVSMIAKNDHTVVFLADASAAGDATNWRPLADLDKNADTNQALELAGYTVLPPRS